MLTSAIQKTVIRIAPFAVVPLAALGIWYMWKRWRTARARYDPNRATHNTAGATHNLHHQNQSYSLHGQYFMHPADEEIDVILYLVLSAEVIGSPLDDELPDLYVEISMKESGFLQRTSVIRQSKTPSWNEELPLYVPDRTMLRRRRCD
jgi:hypothetical protein